MVIPSSPACRLPGGGEGGAGVSSELGEAWRDLAQAGNLVCQGVPLGGVDRPSGCRYCLLFLHHAPHREIGGLLSGQDCRVSPLKPLVGLDAALANTYQPFFVPSGPLKA